MQLVRVVWGDCSAQGGWHTPEQAAEWGKDTIKQEYATVGYVVSHDGDQITIASTYCPERGICNDLSVIPAGCVKRVEPLEHRGKYVSPSE